MIARRAWSHGIVFLCAMVILAGCAAGSPTVTAPESEQDTLLAGEISQAAETVAAATLPASTATLVPLAAATPSIASPTTAGPPNDDPDLADSATAGGTASFAQEVDLLPVPPDDPNAAAGGGAGDPVPAETTGSTVTEPTAIASVDSSWRPPPPPDPGTGLSTVIQGGASDGRLEVALTFDAGADRGSGTEVLDLLRDEGIKATFGMTGVYAEQNPDIVQRMVAEGHQLMNHTWDHPSLTGENTGMPPLTADQIDAQLWDTENLVSDVTGGYAMRPYFRPPYGDYDAASLGYLYNDGFSLTVWWTCDSHGWAGWTAQEIIDYCTTNLAEDEILLMHLGAEAVSDYLALPDLIQSFRDKGYAFVTVEQMLQP